ncbi:MAG TPA: glycosyltransferase [Candidatus Sumerlaeota bacterium]|nr:MAG: GDP-mannose-dependent alpha-(1-6)-phosphatidylinositol monomannoside mannosyltransferase [candidate division BRC1 bacterium ADurb.Bin183]HOE63260.1 glycosyltransferase [Candidatus Sumerlaeota bacterium]HRR29848.1 glycosyltransferase [Candidatus Sumerlaeia bacterium]HON50618.1 glycosyltransferase [Candidatus Sumerlaeota bacterium]HOR65440.1 glycosyltransferase [Candidatus Sumerlaeota bacterium]
MKTAIIHDWLNGMRGGEKVLESLCDLYPDAPIYTLFYEPDRVSQKIRRRKIIPSILQKFPFSRRHYRNYLPLFPAAIGRFDLSGYERIISISHCAAKGVRIPPNALHVCYCLTPMRYIWDLFDVYFRHRSMLSPTKITMALLRERLRRWDVATSRSVDFFVATSRHIAEKIQVYFARESEIIPPPVDSDFFTPDQSQQQDFYLLVSALVPYKRVDVAVEAFRGRHEQLIIAGTGPEAKSLMRNAPRNVKFLGWVGQENLRELYRRCRALIFPPEEDFGIVPLEAMACGKPVIAYGAGGALDTIQDGKTGIFFREQTPASLRNALEQFNPDVFIPEDLRRHACEYSKESFANRWMDFMRGVEKRSC